MCFLLWWALSLCVCGVGEACVGGGAPRERPKPRTNQPHFRIHCRLRSSLVHLGNFFFWGGGERRGGGGSKQPWWFLK